MHWKAKAYNLMASRIYKKQHTKAGNGGRSFTWKGNRSTKAGMRVATERQQQQRQGGIGGGFWN